jgi:predicted acylesterase/phospholipase RssA
VAEKPARLKRDDVKFLALEGGGGKGFAYLGALQVLEEKGTLDQVTGVAGTSAGAITALMLALRMSSGDIDKELSTTNFDSFFDPPTAPNGERMVPSPGGYQVRKSTDCEKAMLKGWDPDKLAMGAVKAVSTPVGTLVPEMAIPVGALKEVLAELRKCLIMADGTLIRLLYCYAWLLSGPGHFNRILVGVLALLVADRENKPLLDVLVPRLPEYLVFLSRDMGLFSGQAARNYFEGLITRAVAAKLGTDPSRISWPDFTFAQMKDAGFRDLLVCGTNLSTGRSELFSWYHTPEFPVADAVRISMSLPMIYKPYVIEAEQKGYPSCGTYVDGGLWNNLPFREIGALAGRKPQDSPEGPRRLAEAAAERATLGLRLEITPPEPVMDFQALLLKCLIVPGETQVIADLDPFIQILDTDGLSTLQFSPDEDVRKKVTKRSRRAMRVYFDELIHDDERDDEDDFRSDNMRTQSVCTQQAPPAAPKSHR